MTEQKTFKKRFALSLLVSIPYWLFFIVAALFAFLLGSEAFKIWGASAETLKGYPFGTEGPWNYINAETYLAVSVIFACVNIYSLISSFFCYRLGYRLMGLCMITFPILLQILLNLVIEDAHGGY